MKTVLKNEGSHWYLPSGQTFHEIEREDGLGLRPVTLADAQAAGAFPSVTNVLRVMANPGLESWKRAQAITSALTLPRVAGETVEELSERVAQAAETRISSAMGFGTLFHAAAEAYAMDGAVPRDALMREMLLNWRGWFDDQVEEVLAAEQVNVHSLLGYGGTTDLVCQLRGLGVCVVDYKTQRLKLDARGVKQPEFYPTFPLQLAAYGEAMLLQRGLLPDHLVSVVIDSAEPGPVYVKVWPANGFHLELFKGQLRMWKYLNNYDPVLSGCAAVES